MKKIIFVVIVFIFSVGVFVFIDINYKVCLINVGVYVS